MTIFSHNGGAGAIFNAGTSGWVNSLSLELLDQPTNTAGLVTANIIRRLSSGTHHESAEVRMWALRPKNSTDPNFFNNPHFFYVMDDRDFTAASPPTVLGNGLGKAPFRAFVGPVSGAVPVYRYLAAEATTQGRPRCLLSRRGSHDNGWTLEGIAFYAFPSPRAGAQPVYRFPEVQADGMWRFTYAPTPTGLPGIATDELTFHAPTI